MVSAPVRPYLQLLRAQVRAQAGYRASFGVDLLSQVGSTVADVLAVLVLFRVTRQLGGFDVRETLVIVGLSASAFATADLVAGNAERLRQYVRTGLFDSLLVRPLAALPQLLLSDLALRRLSRVVFGVGMLVVALALARIEWTAGRVAVVLLAPVAGVVFFSAIFIAGATVAFWWVDSGEVANSLTYGGRDLTSYPMTVYGGLFRRVFGYALGFAFVAYYPALALLGRPDPLGLPGWVGWASPAVAVPAAILAWLCWRIGVRHYRSTGS